MHARCGGDERRRRYCPLLSGDIGHDATGRLHQRRTADVVLAAWLPKVMAPLYVPGGGEREVDAGTARHPQPCRPPGQRRCQHLDPTGAW